MQNQSKLYSYLFHEEEYLVATAGNVVTDFLQLHLGEVKNGFSSLYNAKGIRIFNPVTRRP